MQIKEENSLMRSRLDFSRTVENIMVIVFILNIGAPLASALDTDRPMVDVQEQYTRADRDAVSGAALETAALSKRIHKVKRRLGKNKIPEALRIQFGMCLMPAFERFRNGLDRILREYADSENPNIPYEQWSALRTSLKLLYEEALLFKKLNRETSVLSRTKTSRISKLTGQVRDIAAKLHFVILE